ncbi:MspA family porin [Gordonia sp. TBRC 11910]|uniref:MspA family porin n=1 Tax=Gordonia asplenii TaxID=2725283 RepID=A0A848L5N7_9ACTN|nr:MspA family porin [Gordonia asplenii]NMO03963.1 MspA family porin [Gordonia asplenii]
MKKIISAALAVSGLSAAVVGLSTPAVANADVRIVLPSQTDSLQMGDGTVVSLTRSNERANINPSLGGTPLHRNAWVSATYDARTSKKANKIKIQAGYIVGCQVNLGGLTSTSGGSATGTSSLSAASVSSGASVSIGPGQAVNYYINDWERADDFGAAKHDGKITYKKATHGRLSYTNETIMVNGCAGYAQARSFANVFVDTDNARQILTFYGRPFSLG